MASATCRCDDCDLLSVLCGYIVYYLGLDDAWNEIVFSGRCCEILSELELAPDWDENPLDPVRDAAATADFHRMVEIVQGILKTIMGGHRAQIIPYDCERMVYPDGGLSYKETVMVDDHRRIQVRVVMPTTAHPPYIRIHEGRTLPTRRRVCTDMVLNDVMHAIERWIGWSLKGVHVDGPMLRADQARCRMV